MEYTEYKEKMLEKITSFFDYDAEKYAFSPYAVWLGILSSSALAILLLLWFGVSLSFRIENNSFFDGAGAPLRAPKDTLYTERLTEVVAEYTARNATLEERKKSPLFITDPSW